jgi:uncharacterized membrane protein YqhA
LRLARAECRLPWSQILIADPNFHPNYDSREWLVGAFKKIELAIELLIWNSRRAMFFAVVACLIAYFAVLAMTIVDLVQFVLPVYKKYVSLDFSGDPALHQQTLRNIVGLVDSFLVAIFLLVFSFGMYELFVSEIDPARSEEKKSAGEKAILGLLSIRNLDDLKKNLVKVITAILIVTLFENAVAVELKSPVELVYYAATIVLVAIALFVIQMTNMRGFRDKP